MNKRRKSGSSAATISDESDECATPDRDVTPEMDMNTMTTTTITTTEVANSIVPSIEVAEDDGETLQLHQQEVVNNISNTSSVLLASGRKKKKLDPVRDLAEFSSVFQATN